MKKWNMQTKNYQDMPNWCFTNYVVEGERSEINRLRKKMEWLQGMEKPLEPSDFGQRWLGCLVVAFGGDWNKIHCRGSWSSLDEFGKPDETRLTFSTETAWAPMGETIDFLKQKFPLLQFYYMAEEQNMSVYITNDSEGKYFPERFYVEICVNDNYDSEYFTKSEDVWAWIKERTGCSSEEEVDKWTEERESPDDYISVNEYHLITTKPCKP